MSGGRHPLDGGGTGQHGAGGQPEGSPHEAVHDRARDPRREQPVAGRAGGDREGVQRRRGRAGRALHLGEQLRRRRQDLLRARDRGRRHDPRARPSRRVPRQHRVGGGQRVRSSDRIAGRVLTRSPGVDARATIEGMGVDSRRGAEALSLAALPRPLTPFIGRSAEREALAGAVRVNRLVTATGPGGVGKTRLCLTVAEDLADAFRDGVAFIDLVTVTDDDMVVAAVADAVGAPERAGTTRLEALVATLRDRDALIILDNCEHLLTGARTSVTDLLGACPTLRVLATSRIRLHLAGETVFAVPGLSVDDDAVALFEARMSESGAVTPLTVDDLVTVREIC